MSSQEIFFAAALLAVRLYSAGYFAIYFIALFMLLRGKGKLSKDGINLNASGIIELSVAVAGVYSFFI